MVDCGMKCLLLKILSYDIFLITCDYSVLEVQISHPQVKLIQAFECFCTYHNKIMTHAFFHVKEERICVI